MTVWPVQVSRLCTVADTSVDRPLLARRGYWHYKLGLELQS